MVDDGRDDEEEGEEGGPAAAPDAAATQPVRPPAVSRPAGRRGAAQAEPQTSSYLVCVVDEPVGGSPGGGGGAGAGAQGTQAAAQGATQASCAVEIGLVAVEPSTGAVLYAQFR